MHRHLNGLAIVQRTAPDEAKIVEAHILERSRRRADIAGRLRPIQHESKFVRASHVEAWIFLRGPLSNNLSLSEERSAVAEGTDGSGATLEA